MTAWAERAAGGSRKRDNDRMRRELERVRQGLSEVEEELKKRGEAQWSKLRTVTKLGAMISKGPLREGNPFESTTVVAAQKDAAAATPRESLSRDGSAVLR